jgi:hypothetical protein
MFARARHVSWRFRAAPAVIYGYDRRRIAIPVMRRVVGNFRGRGGPALASPATDRATACDLGRTGGLMIVTCRRFSRNFRRGNAPPIRENLRTAPCGDSAGISPTGEKGDRRAAEPSLRQKEVQLRPSGLPWIGAARYIRVRKGACGFSSAGYGVVAATEYVTHPFETPIPHFGSALGRCAQQHQRRDEDNGNER